MREADPTPTLRPARWLLPLVLGLLALLALAALGVGTRPDAVWLADVRATLLNPPEGCPIPCWAGIRPGVTTLDEALAILAAHPWVGEIAQQASDETANSGTQGSIRWRWNGSQPAPLRTGDDNRLLHIDRIVAYVSLGTIVPLGDMWLLLGRPERGAFLGQSANSLIGSLDGRRILQVTYLGRGVALEAAWQCPVDWRTYWQAETTIIFTHRLYGPGDPLRHTLPAC
ncbi:MAG: hypothetical protein JW910_06315 [Anaerolineae bacterium]|nr:hypothetical protein [Anaerolineae bacterium]